MARVFVSATEHVRVSLHLPLPLRVGSCRQPPSHGLGCHPHHHSDLPGAPQLITLMRSLTRGVFPPGQDCVPPPLPCPRLWRWWGHECLEDQLFQWWVMVHKSPLLPAPWGRVPNFANPSGCVSCQTGRWPPYQFRRGCFRSGLPRYN